jgi:hypothetical protein
MYPFIPVVKTVSPITQPSDPKPEPSKTIPLAKTKTALLKMYPAFLAKKKRPFHFYGTPQREMNAYVQK